MHHLNINHCKITYSTGSGIHVSYCDYLNIERNEVGHTTFYHATAMCGIEVMNPKSIDNVEEAKIIIRENVVYDNQNKIPFFDINLNWSNFPPGFGGPDYPYILDGHGILVFNWPEGVYSNQWFHGRVLVENNLCFGNGFNGIKINDLERADIRGNILYRNGDTPDDQHNITKPTKGIYIFECSDVNIHDNIIWGRGGVSAVIKAYVNDGISVQNNNLYKGHLYLWDVKNVEGLHTGGNSFWGELFNGDLGNNWKDPQFVNPSLDWETCDFSLTELQLSADSAYFKTPKSKISFYGDTVTNRSSIVSNPVKIFPNPNHGRLIIELGKCMTINHLISVYDLYGRLMLRRETGSSELSIDLSSLEQGIYLVRINNAIARKIILHPD